MAFLFGLRQEATLEAVGTTTCLALQKGEFLALMRDFPDILNVAQQSVMAAMREAKDPMLEEIEQLQTKDEKQIAQLSDMLYAAAAGNLEIVEEAVTKGGVNVCEADYAGQSALHIAAAAGRHNVVEFLIKQKAALNKEDHFGKTPLANAVKKGHWAVIRALRDAGGTLAWSETETAGELCDRAREGHVQQLKMLLSCGAHVNAADCAASRCTRTHLRPTSRLRERRQSPSCRALGCERIQRPLLTLLARRRCHRRQADVLAPGGERGQPARGRAAAGA